MYLYIYFCLFTFPVTSVSNTIAQAGEMAMDDDGSVCDDIFFMGQASGGFFFFALTYRLYTSTLGIF